MATRRIRGGLPFIGALLVAAASIAVALTVTPPQQVSVLGEQISVGAAAPSLSLTGPGEADLFGQRLPTVIRFAGPVRPRLTLARHHAQPATGRHASARRPARRPARSGEIGDALASGWIRYFLWEVAIAGGCALVLAGAIAGWARLARSGRGPAGGVRDRCRSGEPGWCHGDRLHRPAHGCAESARRPRLVGQSQPPPVHKAAGAAQADVQAVVIGDSTAAGLGLPGLAHPGQLDRACHRSKDADAADLAAVNHWHVLNLACSGATIPAGLLGPQKLSKVTAPAQLSEAMKATHAWVVIVSIGANDVGWSGLVRLCAVASKCDNSASTAYFQQQLAAFSAHYYQLLGQLAGLPVPAPGSWSTCTTTRSTPGARA